MENKRRKFSSAAAGPKPANTFLERNVAVLFRGIFIAFGFEHLQRLNELLTGFVRLDYGVDKAALGGDIGIGESVPELVDLLTAHLVTIFSLIEIALVDDIYGAFRTHHRN